MCHTAAADELTLGCTCWNLQHSHLSMSAGTQQQVTIHTKEQAALAHQPQVQHMCRYAEYRAQFALFFQSSMTASWHYCDAWRLMLAKGGQDVPETLSHAGGFLCRASSPLPDLHSYAWHIHARHQVGSHPAIHSNVKHHGGDDGIRILLHKLIPKPSGSHVPCRCLSLSTSGNRTQA